MRRRLAVPLVLAGLVVAVAAGVLSGPAALAPADVWRALAGSGADATTREILVSVRLPRVTAALLVGGMLAVSGAMFQALLRNPLAEPYLLGVSSGAALGAVGAIVLGLARLDSWILPGAALLGALLDVYIVFRVAWVVQRLDTRVLLLAGVVSSAFFIACVLLLLTFARAETLQSAFFWTLGSVGQVSWRLTGVLALWGLPGVACALLLSRQLDLLALGEETAASLGTEVERVKWMAYGLASLLAAVAVSVAGIIGFVGLVVPHAVRLTWGSDHGGLVPLSFVLGGGALILADAVGRTAAAPLEIPVGVITAVLGVPVFLVLLRRSARA
ncbi:MAG: FecCD family ABC transporter permease [Gemmatimonadota bacterium]